MPNPSFTENTVRLHILKLVAHKAVGVDKVHSKVLKMCCSSLCKPLSLIFTKTYESGVVPDLSRKVTLCRYLKKVINLNLQIIDQYRLLQFYVN